MTNNDTLANPNFRCDFCSDPACGMFHFPDGCTCSDVKYQRRCRQHLRKADDSCDNFTEVEVYDGGK